ncbi:hypothetical protein PAK_P100093 [Pseudomonas phage PAK_P1]|uniref:Uncharacterized protein n=8 Tax=Viruses TaxID=10239 RepID=V5K303_9CAUD|nr:hypothetical protein PAK_P100093 [Pseudomonas phage PAK_P1]YP_009187029.1 hypothetical protein AU075_gp081 [Pseudomonas phage C11]YP_009200080.1 hypothetical protein K8_144 [Pseudomonas phage K8]YP_009224832.1 hypothetical protein PaoP5_142 [Pseudomonas phage PaoP5]YP_010762088.1 hypothetical protein QE322_gp138 [Pseudomonas phage PaGz-1]YP_010762812.1 hypothetical protein QE326_gp137 [Pseudomonas phage PaZq-1]YP_010764206.1 hypothetical protein QE337_gp140 [Pseudomonas phage HJ01]YP_0107
MKIDNGGEYAYWLADIKEFVSQMDATEIEKRACIAYLISWYQRRVLHRIKREEYEAI